jgi:hypothetical protein
MTTPLMGIGVRASCQPGSVRGGVDRRPEGVAGPLHQHHAGTHRREFESLRSPREFGVVNGPEGGFASAGSPGGLTPIDRYAVPRNSPVGGTEHRAKREHHGRPAEEYAAPSTPSAGIASDISFAVDLFVGCGGYRFVPVRLVGRRARVIVDSGCGTVGARPHRRARNSPSWRGAGRIDPEVDGQGRGTRTPARRGFVELIASAASSDSPRRKGTRQATNHTGRNLRINEMSC